MAEVKLINKTYILKRKEISLGFCVSSLFYCGSGEYLWNETPNALLLLTSSGSFDLI